MNISLKKIGKKFKKDWVLKDLDLTISANSKLAILGPNGSGKSTLLQIISGFITPSEGEVVFERDGAVIPHDQVYQYISIASPYLELVGKLSLKETLELHSKLAGFRNNMTVNEVIETLEMEEHAEKYFESFSSGMKMRIRIALAVLSKTEVLLLDEPLSNIDQKGEKWYLNLIDQHTENRTVVVCSNEVSAEYSFTTDKFILSTTNS